MTAFTSDKLAPLTAETIKGYDISSYGYMDTSKASPALYYCWMTAVVTNLAISANLTAWTNCTVQAWVSTNGVLTVFYEGGQPVVTNYTAGDATKQQLEVMLGSYAPMRFFRYQR
jgi:hypothetical protein